jgi:hypothetical protein
MSVARIHTVKHARQVYAKVAKTDEEGNRVAVPVMSKRTGQQKVGRGGRPMTRRVTVHDRSQPLPMPKCAKCGVTIEVGDPYRWFSVGFRSHYKQIRCTKPICTPRESERESSGIRSEILAAIETAADDLDALTEVSDASEVEAIVQQVGEAFRSAADQYREADEAFGGGGNTENGERADICESGADELESWGTSGDSEPDYEGCDDDIHLPPEERYDKEDDRAAADRGDSECESCSRIKDEWFEALVEEARDAIDSVDQP